MLELYCRPICQRFFFDPLARLLSRNQRLHPLVISLLAVISGITVIPLLYFNERWWAVGMLLLSGGLDALDGTVARLMTLVSDRGAVIDIVGDRVVEFSVIIGLFWVDPVKRGFWALLMLSSILICVTSFLVVSIFLSCADTAHQDKSFCHSKGLMERAEAFAFFIAMILFPQGFMPLAIAFSILVFYTALARIGYFCRL